MIINKRYPNETPEHREKRLAKTRVRDRKSAKERVQRETPEEHEERLAKRRAQYRESRQRETPEQRVKRLEGRKAWRGENKEISRKRWRAYYVKNKEKLRERTTKWQKENREQMRAYSTVYSKNNRGKRNAQCAKRRAAKLERTPAWLTEEELKAIANLFIEAHRRTRATGVTHHVHHIYELLGKTVSGLHVFENLVVMPEKAHYACHSRRRKVKSGYNYTRV